MSPAIEVEQSVDGGAAVEAIAWEGRAQIDLAGIIDQYLAENPCPGPSQHPAHYAKWAADLRAAGEVRLEVGEVAQALADVRRDHEASGARERLQRDEGGR